MRVAEPGSVVLPPPSGSPNPESTAKAASNTHNAYLVDDEASDDETSEQDDIAELPKEPEFHPEQCLFCNAQHTSFDDTLAHMAKTHSFAIPYQDSLTVDLETLVAYLHLVIHGYKECILCAVRRSSVEAIQHHMTAKGHCRFNIASDIAEFYNIPAALEFHADEDSLRLPSGRLLSHRTNTHLTRPAAWKTSRQSVGRRRLEGSTSSPSTSATPSAAQDDDHSDPLAAPSSSLCTQLSRLTVGDQQSLAHLPHHQVRSLLATSARHIDQSRREETHAQLRLEKASNITLTAHFRADTSKRFRGPWG